MPEGPRSRTFRSRITSICRNVLRQHVEVPNSRFIAITRGQNRIQHFERTSPVRERDRVGQLVKRPLLRREHHRLYVAQRDALRLRRTDISFSSSFERSSSCRRPANRPVLGPHRYRALRRARCSTRHSSARVALFHARQLDASRRMIPSLRESSRSGPCPANPSGERRPEC